jgi:hypothetical protein
MNEIIRMPPAAASGITLHDIVEFATGDRFIITGIHYNRPANPYTGVKINGQGTEYKFGPRYKPKVVGHADPTHPALQAKQQRKLDKSGLNVELMMALVLSVERGDLETAKRYAAQLKPSLG